jgi:hypothetical protein
MYSDGDFTSYFNIKSMLAKCTVRIYDIGKPQEIQIYNQQFHRQIN